MSQSLYTAMGGIAAAQTQLNVISNNIANLNTTAFKSSSVNFSDVFSRTISSGSVSTQSTGGTNPIQVGVGVQVSSISKDFNSGSWIATGKPTDLMIEGSGFFTVESSDGQKFYTRAGDFTFDEQGYMVTSGGYKVMGTDNILSSTTTDSNVYIPRSIIATKAGNANIATELLNHLNHCEAITSGKFNLSVNTTNTLTLDLDTTTNNTMGSLAANIQQQIDDAAATSDTATTLATALQTAVTALPAAGNNLSAPVRQAAVDAATNIINEADRAYNAGIIPQAEHKTITDAANLIITTLPAAGTNITAGELTTIGNQNTIIQATEGQISTDTAALEDIYGGVTVTCGAATGGKIKFTVDGTDAQTLSFSNPNGVGVTATNFVTATGMNNSTLDPTTHTYSSNVLDWTVAVSQVTSASLADSNPTCSISADGSIQATYSSGDTLSVQLDDTGTAYKFLYTTSDGIAISDTKCSVDANVAKEANFVIQMASITNTDGLLSVGSNLFKSGPNSGSILYSVGGKLGLGKIESGGLEASNVDLSKEFSNMIVAQRAVQANSRVFTTTSSIMDIIVSMGR